MHAVKKILLEQDKCLVLQPELAKIVGKSAALLFQQIHYWLSSPHTSGIEYQGKKWIYNTYDDWANDLQTISKTTINRSIRKLKDLNFIFVEQLWAKKGNRTNHYTINYDRLEELFPPSIEEKLPLECETTSSVNPISNMNLPSIQNGSILYRTKKTNKKDILINSNTSENLENNLITEEKTKPVAQQMLEIWTRIISPDISPALNAKRSKYLVAALRYKFSYCLKKWEDYCRQIASSDYLMGKIGRGFQIILETALKFDFIQRVFEKQFGIKDIKAPVKNFGELEEDFSLNESEETLTIRHKIANKLGIHHYRNWFAKTQITIEEKEINIYVSSIFNRDWMKEKYLKTLEDILAANINFKLTAK